MRYVSFLRGLFFTTAHLLAFVPSGPALAVVNTAEVGWYNGWTDLCRLCDLMMMMMMFLCRTLYTRCSENHNNTWAENMRFEISYSIMARRQVAAKRKIWTWMRNYKLSSKPQKLFFKLHAVHGLIAFRWAQTLALPCAFGITYTNLTVFRGIM